MALPRLTIGIEEEYQIIHPETRELTSYVQEFLEDGRVVLQDQIQAEFLQSQVEVGSLICNNMEEARAELVKLRRAVAQLADSHGLQMAAASTHPFSNDIEKVQIIDGNLKKIGKINIDNELANGEFMGLTKVKRELCQTMSAKLKAVISQNPKSSTIHVIQSLIDEGQPIGFVESSNEWCEIDDQPTLERAREWVKLEYA